MVLHAQVPPNYYIDVELDNEAESLVVNQTIRFQNNETKSIKTLNLLDWANAYSSTDSPLAKRLVEEYTRSFYLSSKSKRGSTTIEYINEGETTLKWNRPKDQIDVIIVSLENPLMPNESIDINIKYVVKIPDGKFTGHGILDDNSFFFEHFFIRLALRNNNAWEPLSFLDLEESQSQAANFDIIWNIPNNLRIYSNIVSTKIGHRDNLTLYKFSALNQKILNFHIGEFINYNEYKSGDVLFSTNLELDDYPKDSSTESIVKVHSFITNKFDGFTEKYIYISKEKNNKRPYYALTLIPSIIKPFESSFELEITILYAFLQQYFTEYFNFHPRKDFWLKSGLYNFLILQYLEEYYPNKKLLEVLESKALINFFTQHYTLSKLTFEKTPDQFYEFMLRRNLQQPLFTPKEKLIRFNEQIATPSLSLMWLRYFEEQKNNSVYNFIDQTQENKWTGETLVNQFIDFFGISKIDGFEQNLKSRNSLDFSFSKVKVKDDKLTFEVKEKNNISLPFSIGWIRDDSLIKVSKFDAEMLNKSLTIQSYEADYISINPQIRTPEFNPRNNYKHIKNSTLIKPLRLTLIKDIENPFYNQLFYNPRVKFNAYDGISFGVRLNNKTIKSRPLKITAQPLYSSIQNKIIGSFFGTYTMYNENSPFYFSNFSLGGSSFHYDNDLSYTLMNASATIFKRTPDLRLNKNQALRVFWQYVKREQNDLTADKPNYNIAGISYVYANKSALRHITFNSLSEFSKEFGKLSLTTEYRYLLQSGRQLSLRLFAGKFLYKNTSSNYFDLSLTRPTDYLFQYDFLGRSETTGFYSQQFVMAEGGFKSSFDQQYSNNYLFSLNTSMGIWRWIETYGDIGYVKNNRAKGRTYFDLGFRLNLLPDFLELYFPIYNSNGLQLDEYSYKQKVRFVLTLDPKTLSQLFSRKWF